MTMQTESVASPTMRRLAGLEPLRAGTQDVLRLITAGSVDDGKSTLIGRLLLDSKAVYADQVAAVTRSRYPGAHDQEVDLAMLTDGLQAEREQGITIDVAYRYFATPARRFILADAPGHEHYTRNMVTGASTAHAVVVLVDASRATAGKLPLQTRRHSVIASLLGIRHVVLAVNKLDLLDWKPDAFRRIDEAFREWAADLDFAQVHAVPVSALLGDNIVRQSARMPWHDGPALLPLLESLPADGAGRAAGRPLRLPVQRVVRQGAQGATPFRGYAGQVEAGTVRVGDPVIVQPHQHAATVKQIVTYAGSVPAAHAGMAVTLELDQDVDVARGDVISAAAQPARVVRSFAADLCWLDERPLNLQRRYLIRHGTRLAFARIREVSALRDPRHLLAGQGRVHSLAMNDIARASVEVQAGLPLDDYRDHRQGGAFVLIDPATHQTAAAGMVRLAPAHGPESAHPAAHEVCDVG